MTRKGRGCPTPPFSVETNSGETPGHQRRREPQIAQILSRFGAGYRRQDCQGAAEPPRRTENRERSVQARRAKPSTATERPCGATGETVVQSGVSRAPASPESPASPERAVPGRGRVSAPLPKAWRAKPAMPYRPFGPDVRLEWKFGSLEAWRLGLCTAPRLSPRRGALFSVLRSPGRVSAPCPACDSTPLICNKSVNYRRSS